MHATDFVCINPTKLFFCEVFFDQIRVCVHINCASVIRKKSDSLKLEKALGKKCLFCLKFGTTKDVLHCLLL